MYTSLYTCLYTCLQYTHVDMHAYIHAYAYVYMHVYTCVQTYACSICCVHACSACVQHVCTHTHTDMHGHTWIHACVRARPHAHMCRHAMCSTRTRTCVRRSGAAVVHCVMRSRALGLRANLFGYNYNVFPSTVALCTRTCSVAHL